MKPVHPLVSLGLYDRARQQRPSRRFGRALTALLKRPLRGIRRYTM
jgi:hypothetical protein